MKCRAFLRFFFGGDFPGNHDGEGKCVSLKERCLSHLGCCKFGDHEWRESRGWIVWCVEGGSYCNVNIVVCWWL